MHDARTTTVQCTWVRLLSDYIDIQLVVIITTICLLIYKLHKLHWHLFSVSQLFSNT